MFTKRKVSPSSDRRRPDVPLTSSSQTIVERFLKENDSEDPSLDEEDILKRRDMSRSISVPDLPPMREWAVKLRRNSLLNSHLPPNSAGSLPAFLGSIDETDSDEFLGQGSANNMRRKSVRKLYNSALVPIPITDARSRNYLIGHNTKHRSLMGRVELERYFPDKKIKIYIGTWNVNGHDAFYDLEDLLLPLTLEYMPDMYVIGLQEISLSKTEWDVRVQEELSLSYLLYTTVTLGTLHLIIFIRRDLIWFFSIPDEDSISTRAGSMVKTKGAVAVAFTIFGTSFLFINSHLTAHDHKLKDRMEDYHKIITGIHLPQKLPLRTHKQGKDVTARFDCVFWFGDLNFRLSQERDVVLSTIDMLCREGSGNYDQLLQDDQLILEMSKGKVFQGFQESSISFLPTYKYKLGSSNFDSSKNRVPSYTDRILFRSKRADAIECLQYRSVPILKISDHKPVYGIYEVALRPGKDDIPLAAGHFNRDVYLEAAKRRLNCIGLAHRSHQSKVCTIS